MSVPPNDPAVPRVRTRTMARIGLGVAAVLLILLALAVIPRVRGYRALAAAAQSVKTTPPGGTVGRPVAATESGLTLAATTQAIQDAVIYARTSGYLRKRHVDIGDKVRAGQLLAAIESPEVVQQLTQARAELQQSQRT